MNVLVVGFPKSGTTTIHEALIATGFRSVHWRTGENGGFVGELIYRGWFEHGDPFHFLKEYDAIAQADICHYGLNYWPQLDFALLHQIRRLYPDCLFLLPTRPIEKLVASMRAWGDLTNRLSTHDIPGLPAGRGKSDDDLKRWILAQWEACRSHFGDGRFLELDIERPDARQVLSSALGVELKWWGVATKTVRRSEEKKEVVPKKRWFHRWRR
jgi:hypothetical protein